MARTKEEKKLLTMMAEGLLDGPAGKDWKSGRSYMWRAIIKGIPQVRREGPGSRFFNGKENERIDGVIKIIQKWVTDDEKLEFLQKYGWLMDNQEARDYSEKFKPKK